MKKLMAFLTLLFFNAAMAAPTLADVPKAAKIHKHHKHHKKNPQGPNGGNNGPTSGAAVPGK